MKYFYWFLAAMGTVGCAEQPRFIQSPNMALDHQGSLNYEMKVSVQKQECFDAEDPFYPECQVCLEKP